MTVTENKYPFNLKKIIIFGAGKIGRSFIGQLFNNSGYEVVFIDINKKLIDALNEQGRYKLVIKSDLPDVILFIENIRGLHLSSKEEVIQELASAGFGSLSVGQQGLPDVLPLIASALVNRRANFGDIPLDIIIAENMRNSDQFIYAELSSILPLDFPLQQLLGLVETSIGKMVPIMNHSDTEKDPLQVFAEPYNTLIVARNGFRNPVPPVRNMEPKENIKAWVDRKLFIHNLGHATAAYLGFHKHPKAIYLFEVLMDAEIKENTRQTMMQSANILMELYPGEFSTLQLTEHIDDLLMRFGNKALGDTLYRVGCDLYRKLSPEDRLVAPIKAAIRLNMPYELIYKSLLEAINFRAMDENGEYFPSDLNFFSETLLGREHILKNICMLDLPG